jgi:biopolymer transport protein ExbB
MKKIFVLLTILGLFVIAGTSVFATPPQDGESAIEMTTEAATENAETASGDQAGPQELDGLTAEIKRNFIDGDPRFMALVLICLILGLALCIERIVYLNLSSSNTKKLLAGIEEGLKRGGVDAAKEVCRNTSGPVASIFYQGLDRSGGSIEEVEKSIGDYGNVQMSLLERGLSWISLFIAIAPMLGFLGTVIGMIGAFQSIQDAGTLSATIVAEGIKVALITTVSGLVVAIILQIFYNYILSKIDSIVLDMEDSSISFVDLLYRHKLKNQ